MIHKLVEYECDISCFYNEICNLHNFYLLNYFLPQNVPHTCGISQNND